MRKGINPQKDKVEEGMEEYHQVLVPVYIPNEEGYFKQSFDVLKLCLTSLFKTCHGRTYFTIVNNGSHDEVTNYLDSLLQSNQIHELIHTHNIGKVNAVYKGIMGHNFPLITVTDADVLFLNDWQQETYKVFGEFPKSGVVSTTPISKLLKYHTYDTIWKYWFSRKLRFTKPKNQLALERFAESIENPEFYNSAHLNNILTLKGKSANAVIGAGHFVATYRGDVFEGLKERYSAYKLGGKSVRKFFDLPVAEKGYWRLATEDNFTYHMGNVTEPWMQEALEKMVVVEDTSVQLPQLKKIKNNVIISGFKRFIFEKILLKEPIWSRFLRAKGLSKGESGKY